MNNSIKMMVWLIIVSVLSYTATDIITYNWDIPAVNMLTKPIFIGTLLFLLLSIFMVED